MVNQIDTDNIDRVFRFHLFSANLVILPVKSLKFVTDRIVLVIATCMGLVEQLKTLSQLRIFRYLVAAGTATVADTLVYFILFQWVILQDADLFSRHSICLSISYTVGVITNFLITKYYVFQESTLKTQTQFFRFLVVAILVFIANFYLMKFLFWMVPLILPYPIINNALIIRFTAAGFVAILSFISHKIFSFEIKS